MVEYLESLVFGTQQWSNWVTSLVYFAMVSVRSPSSRRSPPQAFPAATVLIALMLLIAGLLKRMFPIKAGVYSVHESMYYRKWWASQVESHLLKMLYGIWETVYISRVLRLLGADIGHEVEVATVQGTNLDLLKIGHESFVASNVVLGDEEICGGYMHLLPTVLGNRVFLGNSSYNPAGTVLPDNFLLGVQSRAPCNDQVQTGQTWVGSPPLLLPKRDLTQSNFPDYLTFHPVRPGGSRIPAIDAPPQTPIRRLARGVIEGVRVVFPLAFMIGCAYNMLYYGGELLTQQDWIGFVLVLLAMSVAYGLLSCMTAFLFKWVFIGRFDKRAAPMWTLFLWLSEFQETLYFALAVTNFLQMLVGTPFLAPVLRLYGMDVGRDVYMGTFDFPEPDCVHIGDGAELNFMSSVQPHVYEDRVLKIEHAYVGKRSTIGVRTIVLLGSRVGDDCDVGPLSLVMKGEEVQASSRWHGCPLKPWVKICSVEVPPACVQDLV
jgi:non-ribosomal peptide synthetase-like protein